jgi:glucose-1-phosphate cytidylyltransferase
MVEIGGRPILWHLLRSYAHHGFKDFVLALGYKGEVIKRYFVDYCELQSHLRVSLAAGTVTPQNAHLNWNVDLIDTGSRTDTGGVKRLKDWLGNETFMLTHGDGVSDIDAALPAFHKRHGARDHHAVRPPARFGGLELDGETVKRFTEKPQTGEGWINGGFFVLEPGVLDYLGDDDAEREPLERLAVTGSSPYRHNGFGSAWTRCAMSGSEQLGRRSSPGRSGRRRRSGRIAGCWSPAPRAIGAWFVKDLIAAGADVTAPVQDADPRSELYRSGDINHCTVVNALKTTRPLSVPSTPTKSTPCFIWGAGDRGPSLAVADLRSQRRALNIRAARVHPTRASRSHRRATRRTAHRRLSYTEDMPLEAGILRSLEERGRRIAQFTHTYRVPVGIARCGNVLAAATSTVADCARHHPQKLRGERPVVRSDGQHVRDYS